MTSTFRLAGSILLAFSALAVTAREARPDDAKSEPTRNPVEGAWNQVEQKNGAAQAYQKFPEGMGMTNCVTGGRFIWTIVKDGKVLGVGGGRYKVAKDKYVETIEYVSGSGVPASFAGSTFEFTVTVTGNTLHKVGTIKVNGKDYKVDEKWARCE